MSTTVGTASGVTFSSLGAAGQAQDGDEILSFQLDPSQTPPAMMPRRASPLDLARAYVPPAAVLLGSGPGASRGLAGAAAPSGGEPFVGYGLHPTLELVLPLAGAPAGTLPVLRVATGVAGGAMALDASGNANVPGSALSFGDDGAFVISRDGNGHLVLNIQVPDTEDGFAPVVGSNVLYRDGGVLKLA